MPRTLPSIAPREHPVDRPEPAITVPPSVVSASGPKRRRPSWVLLGVVLVGVSALTGAWVFAATSERMSVMVAGRDIDPGEIVTASDLRVVEIGGSGTLRAVQPDQQDLIVGQAARGPIPAGTVMNTGLVAGAGEVIPAGQVVVGASLEPGAAPITTLQSGDRVTLLGVAKQVANQDLSSAAASVLATGTVWSIEPATSGSVSSKLLVALLVPAEAQTVVAQAAADGRLRLSLLGAEP